MSAKRSKKKGSRIDLTNPISAGNSARMICRTQLWDKYQKAYEDALTRCNTDHAPWHIVPSDRKWSATSP
ncbi:MAG: hypothetical protein CMJ72_11150 [Planctomycetaceae bacterium]|nr:hypothetical protein [Planctomycetaceae bacterium]HCK40307.1 hypothetical protein [Planctomycetaceae bacterium]